jgi:hypothetical protein
VTIIQLLKIKLDRATCSAIEILFKDQKEVKARVENSKTIQEDQWIKLLFKLTLDPIQEPNKHLLHNSQRTIAGKTNLFITTLKKSPTFPKREVTRSTLLLELTKFQFDYVFNNFL